MEFQRERYIYIYIYIFNIWIKRDDKEESHLIVGITFNDDPV